MWTDGDRVKAARMLGRFTSPAKLGQAINKPRVFGGRAIREVERDVRTLADHEAEWIAKACKIDPAFFTIDFSALTSRGEDAGEGTAAQVEFSPTPETPAAEIEQGHQGDHATGTGGPA